MAALTQFDEQKRVLADTLLPLCPFVLIDASREDVTVPSALQRKDLVLRLGRDPQVMGMPDLDLTESGFQVTISVQGVRHFVTVPWSAVSRMWVADPFVGPMVVWPDDASEPRKPESQKPGLRLVK